RSTALDVSVQLVHGTFEPERIVHLVVIVDVVGAIVGELGKIEFGVLETEHFHDTFHLSGGEATIAADLLGHGHLRFLETLAFDAALCIVEFAFAHGPCTTDTATVAGHPVHLGLFHWLHRRFAGRHGASGGGGGRCVGSGGRGMGGSGATH